MKFTEPQLPRTVQSDSGISESGVGGGIMPETVHWDAEIFKAAKEAAGKLPPEVRYRPLGSAAKEDSNGPASKGNKGSCGENAGG
jgi:hypothetical protein